MERNRMKRALVGVIPLVALIIGIGYNSYVRSHTFTITSDNKVKNEQIQALAGRVKVSSTEDTDVVFTDVETGETFIIDYMTSGTSDTIQLERGKWYQVEGDGELTMSPVNVRIE